MSTRWDFKFAIGDPSGSRSSVWKVFSRKSEVYVSTSNMGGIQKLSFHSSGICRNAFTKEHGTPKNLNDRAYQKWTRASIPDRGTMGGSRVLAIAFPTDYLSTAIQAPKKPPTWIAAASKGGATIVEMFFTLEDLARVEEVYSKKGLHRIIGSRQLETGELFVISSYNGSWENRDLQMPRSHGTRNTLVFSTKDPFCTGRPIRLKTYSNPCDGDALEIQELGGYATTPENAQKILQK